ncbi:MAG: hypothetical protein E7425_03540 [Ruminococcaceae bacterium]|nr:hypothetical protein [Oscillospiraceae bacterium]
MTANEDRSIRLDRMRFTKNKTSANLALLAILFDVCFFISIYESDVGTYYYNILVGASILYNLIFMLAAFLCSEGVKNYKAGYAWLMGALGLGQLARIFIYPMKAHAAVVTVQDVPSAVMGDAQFTRTVVFLCLSAACLLVGAVIGVIRSRALAAHIASLDSRAA